MNFFQPIVDFLKETFEWFLPFAVLDVEEHGIIKRWGKFNRVCLEPGFYWHIPFGIEHMATCPRYKTTHTVDVEAQTQDGRPVVARMVVKYRIANPVPFLTEVGDEIDVLDDLSGAALFGELVGHADWSALVSDINNGMDRRILETLRAEVNQFGFKIYTVKFKRLIHADALAVLGVPETLHVRNH